MILEYTAEQAKKDMAKLEQEIAKKDQKLAEQDKKLADQECLIAKLLVFHVLKDNSRTHNNLPIQPAYL